MPFEQPSRSAVESQDSGFWKPETFEVGGKTVEFFGVAHDPDTFEAHEKEIREAVRRASVVFLEGAPDAEGVTRPDVLKQVSKALEEMGLPPKSPDVLRDEINRTPGVLAYRLVERIAAEEGKPVAVADPMSFDTRFQLERKDEQAIAAKLFMMTGGAIGVGLTEALERIRKDMTRRNFLKGVAGAAAALGAASFFKKSKTATPEGAPSRTKPSDALLYEENDFREVVAAAGLERLSTMDFGPGPVVAFYGANHAPGIRHFSASPKERAVKDALYAPFRSVGKPFLRLFAYDNGARSWKPGSVLEL